jgi:HlyD family secretion protein
MKRLKWILLGFVTFILVGGTVAWLVSPTSFKARADALRGKKGKSGVRVVVIRPTYTSLDRTTVEQGTVQAYETVDLFAEASGFLKSQTVDIGDHVIEGQPLAKIDVPELEKELAKARATVARSKSKVVQAQKAVSRARSEVAVAQTGVPTAEAALEAASASKRYRQKAHKRIEYLRNKEAVDLRLLEESEERRDAAIAAEKAAVAAVQMARVQVDAAKSKVEQAQADEAAAEADVDVAQAEVERLQVRIDFSVIRAPFKGVITKRYLSPGAYVRSAAQGEKAPVFAIDRTDRVRVVVPIPDRHVPFADKGDPARVEIENLGAKAFDAKISRIQGAEDQATRTMRVEIDLPNPKDELRPGMFAKVTVNLHHLDRALVLPSGCLQGEAKEGKGHVYVVRDGSAVLVPIRIGTDNGVVFEVLSGLKADDEVVRNYSGTLTNGAAVRVDPTEITNNK